MAAELKKITVTDKANGTRVDKFLAEHFQLSRSKIQNLFAKGSVRCNGELIKPSHQVTIAEEISVELEEVQTPSLELKPLELTLDILFEDPHVLVINKPAGLVIHPAAGHSDDTLVNALVHHSSVFAMRANSERPGIVHRLDKETSGVLVIGKTDEAIESLSAQFKNRSVGRYYEAICVRTPRPPEGEIVSFLARHPVNRKKMASLKDLKGQILRLESAQASLGKFAATQYKILSSTKKHSLVELKLRTGRTHQIRVHLSEAGHPVFGDTLYGFKGDREVRSILGERFLLHARELTFAHPSTNERLRFEVPWPKADAQFIKELGFVR